MENVVSNDDRIAIAEVDYIIHHMNERYLNKIPQKIQDYITILKKRNIEIYVDPKVPLEKQGLKEFTLYFLMILNLKYWCDEERRKEILYLLEMNQKKFDDKINNIFNQAESMQGESDVSASTLNRPRQVIIANTTSNTEADTNIESEQINENSSTNIQNESKNAIEQLQEETAISESNKGENFFKKFINKIKAMLVKSKQ